MSILVKENDRGSITVVERAGYLIELIPMVYNWRLVLTPMDLPLCYDAGWCYFGTDEATFERAHAAALAFDPVTQAEPEGYDKALQDRKAGDGTRP